MAVSFERLADGIWLARMGEHHLRYGDDYEAVAIVQQSGNLGLIKGFVVRGSRSPLRLMREALRAVRDELGLEPKFYRRPEMAKMEIEVNDWTTTIVTRHEGRPLTYLIQNHKNQAEAVKYQKGLADGVFGMAEAEVGGSSGAPVVSAA